MDDITADLRIIGLWWLMVGLSAFVSVLMSMRSLKNYVEAIDSILPRPIFSSVADMTRVTMWEAKRSLQIDGDMSHIQWTEATRNGTGGIDLIGYHRAPPDVDEQNNIINPRVRAQRYIIQTDMWGRILNTLVRDVRVPHTILPDHRKTGIEPREKTRPPPDYITTSPEPPSGDNLAQSFFTSPSPPSKKQEQRVVVEALASQPTRNGQTAVSPSLTNIPPPEPETPGERKERLCQQLAGILSQKFTDNQLQKLYKGLGLDYGRSPGTRLESCQDIVRFYQRRQQLPQLVEEAINMQPYIMWGDIFDLLES